jgi:hypothetical protein
VLDDDSDDDILLILQSNITSLQRSKNVDILQDSATHDEPPEDGGRAAHKTTASFGKLNRAEDTGHEGQEKNGQIFRAPRQQTPGSATIRWSASHVQQRTNRESENRGPGFPSSASGQSTVQTHFPNRSSTTPPKQGCDSASYSAAQGVQLQFPPPEQNQMTRTAAVPNVFEQGPNQYASIWSSAVEEELNLR